MTDRVLGIDPSSTRTGYAVMTSPTNLVEAGALTGENRRDPALDRIDQMVSEVTGILSEQRITRVVIEVTTGHIGRRHGGGGAGLATYGMAVGAIRNACCERLGASSVTSLYENRWTNGVPKRTRQRVIAAALPAYRIETDSGGDIADAIGLCVYWFKQRRAKEMAG